MTPYEQGFIAYCKQANVAPQSLGMVGHSLTNKVPLSVGETDGNSQNDMPAWRRGLNNIVGKFKTLREGASDILTTQDQFDTRMRNLGQDMSRWKRGA